jgi:acyl-CoA thioesterase-1
MVALFLVGCSRPRPAETAATVRLLALGDSFTIGTGSSEAEAFPARLAERWRQRGCVVQLRNVAVNGYSTEDVIERELGEIASFRPTFITFAAGANDIVRGVPGERYRANVARILSTAAHAVQADRVLVLPQPKWSQTKTGAMFGATDEKLAAFDSILRVEAEHVGARYIDLSPLMTKQIGMTASDGLHPSAEAHEQWAAAIDAAVSCR